MENQKTRERLCSECGKLETVRCDNPALRCRACGAKPGAARGAAAQRAKFPRNICRTCGADIRGIRIYCSRACKHADQRHDLEKPAAPPSWLGLTQIEISRAGEMIVAAELTLLGFPAFLAGTALPYDVVVDLGHRLIKLQVKTTRGPRRVQARVTYMPGYLFHLARCGTGGKRNYNDGDFDCYALLALDTREIAFVPAGSSVPRCITLRPSEFEVPKNATKWRTMSDYPWEKCLADLS